MSELIEEMLIKNMYSLEHTAAGEMLGGLNYPWEALPLIKDFIVSYGATLNSDEYDMPSENVWIHKTAKVWQTTSITGPCVIGANTEVRQCAFIRGNALVGENCVIGNSTELKNVIIFDNVQVPHYNYVGDSILGYKSHMGAGSITSNVKSDKTLVHVKGTTRNGDVIDIATGLKKFGAMLGDNVEVGCNSVLNPGTVIGSCSNIYPLSPVRGYVPGNSIYKTGGVIVEKK
ncbi:MAG: UDP-N-acetylglucosamine pyrophosphorylase [Wujia sp.]